MKTMFGICTLGAAVAAISIRAEGELKSDPIVPDGFEMPELVDLEIRDDNGISLIYSLECDLPVRYLSKYEKAENNNRVIRVYRHGVTDPVDVYPPDFEG